MKILRRAVLACSVAIMSPMLMPAQATSDPFPPQTEHPALFLVGDSIVRTGSGTGDTGPWGWGAELIPMFDPARIHVYNVALGGRSSRGYMQEGAWQKVMDRLQPGDWVIVQFGHNDAANSQNYPDRTTLKGNGDETQEIESPVTHQPEAIHSYGWYMRQYVKDAKGKGASVIVCSPPPRNKWEGGKILRGLDGYAGWAQEAARQSGAYFIDLNTISADKYDALGEAGTKPLFNDFQHSRKAGAKLNAESVATGIRQLNIPLENDLLSAANGTPAARGVIKDRPDPKEIPLPVIRTDMKPMPGVDQLPVRKEMPPVMVLNDGKPVKTIKHWDERRQQMRRTLDWYALGEAPPPPGNVKGKEISSEIVLNGKVKYRLVHLTFGPKGSLGLDIGIFTPVGDVHVPTLISPSGLPPGATALPRLPQGANQGRNEDVLLVTGPMQPGTGRMSPAPNGAGGAPVAGMGSPAVAQRRRFGGPRTAEQIAETNQAIQHGWAYVTFNYTDCGEDTTLRNADGSWAYRTTRFFPAYPNYDWGLLRAWAWGVSRIVDYLETDPSVDKTKFVVTGVSRTGKSALIAGAYDERIAMVAPVASSGGGTPAYRYSGSVPDRGGKEGLTEMVRKYPNWYSDHLHQFWGQPDKLPFDEHWLIALCAPRPFISLEGDHDQNVNQNGVYRSLIAAEPAYAFFHASDKLGISFADRPHGMVQGDWDALLAFGDKFLMGKPTTLTFDKYPAGIGPNAAK